VITQLRRRICNIDNCRTRTQRVNDSYCHKCRAYHEQQETRP
jgi:hypothetical protein